MTKPAVFKTASHSPRPTAPTQPPLLASPHPILGLNMQLGLKHVGGNEALYLQLLRRFVRDFAGFATRVESMLTTESWDAAVREAHTFRGLSATLGASELKLLAASLEKALASRSLHGALDKLAATGIAFEAMSAALNAKFATDDAKVVALTPEPSDPGSINS